MSIVLTTIIVLALIALGAIIATWILTKQVGRGEVMADLPAEEAAQVKEANRLFALNGDINQVGFDTVKRGYRPDQVDDLVHVLTQEVMALRAELGASESNAQSESDTVAE